MLREVENIHESDLARVSSEAEAPSGCVGLSPKLHPIGPNRWALRFEGVAGDRRPLFGGSVDSRPQNPQRGAAVNRHSSQRSQLL